MDNPNFLAGSAGRSPGEPGVYTSNFTLYTAQTYNITIVRLLGSQDSSVMRRLPGSQESGAMRRSVLEYSLAVVTAAVDPMGSWAKGPGLVTATVGQIAKFWVLLDIPLAALMTINRCWKSFPIT